MDANSEPDYIVVRAHPDLPAGFLPEKIEGLWLDMSGLPKDDEPIPVRGRYRIGSEAVAIPTGRFEQRDDGAVAEIYEVRP